MNKYVAIVVTFNRKTLLEENINALLMQTRDDFDICIIDNASTDGTRQLISQYASERMIYKNTGKNLGGAGGFAFGVKQAVKLGYEYCWLMDDDTIPEVSAFSSLVEKAEQLNGQFAFIGSMVHWTDGTPCIMNMTKASNEWYLYEKEIKLKLVPVARCSFVSVLIPISAVRKVGLPLKQFFLYGDDTEYTERLQKTGKGYMDLESIVVHKMAVNAGTDITTIPLDKLDRCFYDSRNRFYIARKNGAYGIAVYFYYQLKFVKDILSKSKDAKKERLLVLCKGTLAGLVFFPHVEYMK